MNISGIVAEFNPFHSGHEYLISKTRDNGADAVIAVMSGNFVQRCEPAFFEKHCRANAAVKNGVDLVIELPFRYAVGSAEKFAAGAVDLLCECGIDTLAFGSECGNVPLLEKTAETIIETDGSKELKAQLATGISFASARRNILAARGIALDTPNDILATEYIKALKKNGKDIALFTVKRTDDYNESASAIRERILSGKTEDLSQEFIDMINLGYAPAKAENIEKIILAFLRNAQPSDFENIYGINTAEGVDKRIIQASKAATLEGVYAAVKSKRIAFSAVKRAILSAYFRLRPSNAKPPYIHVLAANETGKKLLKKIASMTSLPVVANLADLRNVPGCAEFTDEERRATDLFNLALPKVRPGMTEFTDKISF